MNIRVLVGVFVLLLIGVSCAHGFDDSVQRYPTGQISDYWIITGDVTKNNYETVYPTSYSIRLYSFQGGNGDIELIDLIDLSYFSFTDRYALEYHAGGWPVSTCTLRIYDDAFNEIGTFDASNLFVSHGNGSKIEFITSGTDVNIYANGVYQTDFLLSSAEEYGYIKLDLYSSSSLNSRYELIIDDFTTSSIIGMNEEWTEAPTYIDTSYGVQSMFSFPTAVYTLETKHVATGTVINTTVLPSDQGEGDKPAGFVRWNRPEIYGTDWGLYHVQLFRDSTKLAETTFTYFDSTISGSVAFDQDSYSQGETANIDYTITSADFATYTYYLKLMNVYGTVQDTYTLTAATGTKTPTLEDYDSGIYYAILSRTSKSTGVNEEFAYDYASVTETVYINGNVTEAVSGFNMQNVSIQYLQGSTYYNTTSAADGSYNVSDLSVSVSTAITANVTYVNDTNFGNNSYNLSTFSFTPLAAEIYNVDLILFDVNHTYDNVSAYGLVYDNIYHQPIESATVNIYNSTWSNSTTSTATGYYVFHNLIANGTYSINATATGYIDTIDYSINTTTLNATRQDVPMSTLYTVTVKARDATTLAYLSDFTATLDGTEGTAVNGTVTFTNIEYGLHAISAIADDFYPSATTPLIDEDTEITLDLTRLASEYYAPHRVKFTVKSLWGTLYSGVTTSVYTGATASGDTLYTGTTGTDGAVVFELSEDVQYTLTFINESAGIDREITIYPIENAYNVYVIANIFATGGNIISDDISVSIETATAGANAYINVTYTDNKTETTALYFYLNQTNINDPQNQTLIASSGEIHATGFYSFTVTDYVGEAYLIHVHATHDTYGDIKESYSVRFEGLLDSFGWDGIWVLIALGCITFTAFMFGAKNATQGSFVICVEAWFFIAMGMFGDYNTIWFKAGVAMATLISILANMEKHDSERS